MHEGTGEEESRADEGRKPDGLGRVHEQFETPGRGTGTSGNPLSLVIIFVSYKVYIGCKDEVGLIICS